MTSWLSNYRRRRKKTWTTVNDTTRRMKWWGRSRSFIGPTSWPEEEEEEEKKYIVVPVLRANSTGYRSRPRSCWLSQNPYPTPQLFRKCLNYVFMARVCASDTWPWGCKGRETPFWLPTASSPLMPRGIGNSDFFLGY